MDIQGYVQHPTTSPHYADVRPAFGQQCSPSPVLRPLRIPALRPDGPSKDQGQTPSSRIDNAYDSPMSSTSASSALDPSLLFSSKDKRKSSPAILGLLGLSDEAEAQLKLHLSHHRNSIEAAMLLANFNRPQPPLAKPPTDPEMAPGSAKDAAWQDDLPFRDHRDWSESAHGSGGSHSSNCSVKGHASRKRSVRRYSFDANLSWNKMPTEFIERSTLAPKELKQQPSTATSPRQLGPAPSPVSSLGSRGGWIMHEHSFHERDVSAPAAHGLFDYGDEAAPRVMYPPISASSSGYTSPNGYGLPPPHRALAMMAPPSSPHPLAMPEAPATAPTTPTATTPSQAMSGHKRSYTGEPPQTRFYQYPYPASPGVAAQPVYYFHEKVPLPPHLSDGTHGSATKMRRRKAVEESEPELEQIAPGHPAFPEMTAQDVEAARMDVEARPRRQKLRFPGDLYTPQWVRYNGQAKEGLCDTCKPGKWLQLKNSAFWYHKQFLHGISSVSGREFIQPLETRWIEQDLLEGLCHQCNQWVSVSNVKRKNSVLWYRHAHKCHVYHKPKSTTPAK